MSGNQKLHDIRNHFFDESEKLWKYSLCLNVAMQLLLMLSAIINNNFFLYGTGFIALLTPLTVTWLRNMASFNAGRGDKCRRLILYADGLGRPVPPEAVITIRGWAAGSQLSPAPFDPPFYNSALPPGPARLADITMESAYFTKNLSEKILKLLNWILTASAAIYLTIIYFGFTLKSGSAHSQIIGKILLLFAVFILGGDLFMLKQKYEVLKKAAHDAFESCSRLAKEPEPDLSETFQTVEEYHLTLIGSPPIPFCFYKKYQDELNRAFQSIRST